MADSPKRVGGRGMGGVVVWVVGVKAFNSRHWPMTIASLLQWVKGLRGNLTAL